MILITEFMDEDAVKALAAEFKVDYAPELADHQADIPARAKGCRAIIVRNRTQVTAELIAAVPMLECVGRLGVGLDNIDLDACTAGDVTVYPATGANTLSVAEYVIGTAMVLLRGAYAINDAMIAGKWPRGVAGQGHEISGKTLGLVGYGGIARETARIGHLLGMHCMGYDPFLHVDDPQWGDTHATTLDDILASSDVISLHVPLTRDTKHLIGAAQIATMNPGAVLINAARGGVVDEAAVVAALKAGKLGGAALDTFEVEPLGAKAGAMFKNVPNLILSPHIGGVTAEANTRVSSMIAERIGAHLRT